MRREYPNRPLVGTGALIFRSNDLLLIKRGAQPGLGKWSIPGGLVELGEKVEDAMKRETREEVGLDVEPIRLMDAFDSIITDGKGRIQYHFVVVNFLARIVGGSLRTASDILEARWVSLREVEKYDLTDSFGLFLKKHIKELKQTSTSSISD